MPTARADIRGRAPWLRVLICTLLLAAGLHAARTPAAAAAVTAAPGPAPAAGEFVLTAGEITIDGLRIEGTGPAPGDTQQRTTLRLSATQALATGLAVTAPVPRCQLVITCPANCYLAGSPARLYVLELTATPVVADIPLVPITLSPTFPLPPPAALGILQLPRLTFRDLRARLVLATGDVIATPATRIDLLPRS